MSQILETGLVGTKQLYTRRIKDIAYRSMVSCSSVTTIKVAAKQMEEHRVSCLFVTANDGSIIAYVTDIILRNQVIAGGVSSSDPIRNIMNTDIKMIDAEAYVYDALLLMYNHKIRYLLVEKEGEYVGFLSRNKLISEQAQSPLVFIQSVKLARSIKELEQKWLAIPFYVEQLIKSNVQTAIVNKIISSIIDIITQNIIEKALSKAGPAPVKFLFMVLGSEGREEQTLKTDQDNAIIYDDRGNENRAEVRTYFLTLATDIVTMLDQVGIHFCTGGYMASNPEWTHSLSHWKKKYQSWIDNPNAETAIKFTTFFDCRLLYGDQDMMKNLMEYIGQALQRPLESFFMHMTKNALQYTPPTTIFNQVKTMKIKDKKVLDLKRLMTPIVDLARLYALRNFIFKQNTGDRLSALCDMGVFTEKQFKDIYQAYYYLMNMRLNLHATQIIYDKEAPDNYIEISKFTKIEWASLKQVFNIIEEFQMAIKVKFTNNLLG